MTPPRLTDERIAEMATGSGPTLPMGEFTRDEYRDTHAALCELQRLRSERVKLVEGLRNVLQQTDDDAQYIEMRADIRELLSSIDDKESGK